MRRSLALSSLGTVTLVLLAFLVPLWVVTERAASSRAREVAALEAQPVAALVGTLASENLSVALAQVNARQSGRPITVFLSDGTQVGAPAARDAEVAVAMTGRAFTTVTNGGEEVLLPVLGRPEGSAVVRVFIPESQLNQGVTTARLSLIGLAAVLLGIALVVADRLARSVTRPVKNLAAVAERLIGGDLEARVKPEGPAEVRAVGETLNRLGVRVSELLEAEREAVADLSHRLRTPLTALRLDVESLPPGPDRERLITDLDSLRAHVDEVIRAARRPEREGLLARCDAATIAAERAAFWQVLAEDQGRSLDVAVPSMPMLVRLAPQDLAAAVDALLGNVFAHTQDDIACGVRVRSRKGGGAMVTVWDAGPGLPERMIQRGASGGGGTGLGLDIARSTAVASGGELIVGPRPGRPGTEVTLELGPPPT